jgi:hypothetical protein
VPPGRLSRGQQKRPLSNSYKRFGLCDSLRGKEVYGADNSACCAVALLVGGPVRELVKSGSASEDTRDRSVESQSLGTGVVSLAPAEGLRCTTSTAIAAATTSNPRATNGKAL